MEQDTSDNSCIIWASLWELSPYCFCELSALPRAGNCIIHIIQLFSTLPGIGWYSEATNSKKWLLTALLLHFLYTGFILPAINFSSAKQLRDTKKKT